MLSRLTLAPLLALAAGLPCAPAAAQQDWFAANLDALVDLYKHFHTNPELSYREKNTSERLAEELQKTGAEVTRRVGGYGVVALLRNGEGPTVMVRGDMDALPVAEQTGLPYASKIRGKAADGKPIGIMHACGHDVHMTNLVGTARWLADHKDRWRGTVMLIGQPAEERSGGAKAMLKDGLFERFPRPDFALALHVAPNLPTGQVSYRPGPAMANVDSVDITVFGKGGHGAAPHTTIDPVVQASQLVLQLQTIVSREIDPVEAAVITVGSIHAGSKHNIISNRCDLQLTVRSYSTEVRAHLIAAISRKALAVAQAAAAPTPEVKFSEGTPALVNDPALVDRAVEAFRRTLGKANVVKAPAMMAAEDFGRFGRAGVPIFMFWLGTVAPARLAKLQAQGGPPGLHSGFFYPDARDALHTGIRAMTAAVVDLLKP